MLYFYCGYSEADIIAGTDVLPQRKGKNMLKREGLKNRAVSKRKGQSTVEYLILAGTVLAVFLVFAGGSDSPLGKALNTTLTQGLTDMINLSNRLSASRGNGT